MYVRRQNTKHSFVTVLRVHQAIALLFGTGEKQVNSEQSPAEMDKAVGRGGRTRVFQDLDDVMGILCTIPSTVLYV